MWRIPVRFVRLSHHLLRGVLLSQIRHTPEVRGRLAQRWYSDLNKLLAITVIVRGTPADSEGGCLWLPNHVSWLDIPLLGSMQPGTVFLSKSEVGRWPVIGRLARAAGTLFMNRGAGAESARNALVEGFAAGKNVVIFAEGTTSDGADVRRLHARLIQPALDASVPIQPIALRFCTEDGVLDRRAAFIDDDHLIGSLWRVLRARSLLVHVHFLDTFEPLDSQGHVLSRDRIARMAEQRIRQALQNADSDTSIPANQRSSSILPS
ncbi:MAG TPA: lysophospholipid acyltransferase family protein [Halothiobacillus sp.]|nr:lysophospholipid acyltransferase family protein [Halothiobacillus sp.]